MEPAEELRRCVREALQALGVRRLVFAIHDANFPSAAEEDTGRGAPTSREGMRLLTFVRDLGFDGIQLGPQGLTSEGNPSPYDSAIFSRSLLSIDLATLTEPQPFGALLAREELAPLVAGRPAGRADRVAHRYAWHAHHEALRAAYSTFTAERSGGRTGSRAAARARAELALRFERFKRAHAHWLERDALYDALLAAHGGATWAQWSGDGALDARLWSPRPGEAGRCERRRRGLRLQHADTLERYRFGQFIAHEQHARLREGCVQLGLRLFGDLQVGFSDRDTWSRQSLFLPNYGLGAPPSRTNPEGQPWGYPVLDPHGYFVRGASPREGRARPGPVLRLVAARMHKVFSEYDGVRIDHPHGLVCPWVYDVGDPDPHRAVQAGARLFASPDLPDHPALAPFAIAGRADLNPDPRTPRHADDWVVRLTPGQVERYGALFDVVVRCARAHRRDTSDLLCEVLSTIPHPLCRVLESHGLGRFRVTQKAALDDPTDGYRSENAEPADWIMVGTHDTPPLWRLLGDWERRGELTARAAHLADRLAPEPGERAAFAEALARDPALLAHAQFADLFASRAQHVMVWFADLFGLTDVYNAPGTVREENWTLRLSSDWRRAYGANLRAGRALNLPWALALALRARDAARSQRGLLERLEGLAAAQRLGAGAVGGT